jgi:hypothetical protein
MVDTKPADGVKEKLVALLEEEYKYKTYEDMADGMIAAGVTFAADNHVGGKKTPTNADRIRAMSDEELADFWYEGADDRYCKNYPKCGELLCTEDGIPEEECKRCLLNWLLQSAEAAR